MVDCRSPDKDGGDLPGSVGICGDLPGSVGICGGLWGSAGICGDLSGNCKNMRVPRGISGYLLASVGSGANL